MKNFIVALVLGGMFSALNHGAGGDGLKGGVAKGEAAREKTAVVLKAIREWDNAYIRGNPSIVKALLAEDYIGIDHDGEVTRKGDEIALVKSGEYVLISVEDVEAPKVRFYGSTAIVTTLSNVKQRYKGKEKSFTGRATTVCVEKKGGGWEIVSWHASKVEAKQ